MRFKSITQVAAIAIMLIVAFGSANAQNAVNRNELKQDKKDIVRTQKGLRDDRADYNRLSNLIEEWNRARKFGMDFKVQHIERQINLEIKNDLKETKRQIKQFAREVERSRDEYKFDNNGVAFSKKVVLSPNSKGYNSRVVRVHKFNNDDFRDLQDDIRDLKIARRIMMKKEDIAQKIFHVQNQIDMKKGRNVKLENRQMTLMKNYLDLEKQEIKLAIRELREDRHEFCEDLGRRNGF